VLPQGRNAVDSGRLYIGFLDKIPFGAAMNKGLTMKMGLTNVQNYL
jgi:hypothetical protein